MTYLATFFSHYGAVAFSRRMAADGIPAKAMPVPRRVSSSCGTGVKFETEEEDVASFADEGVDKIFQSVSGEYTLVFDTEPASAAE